jgi:phenylacetic acid degradation operon negative regulatory protein
MFRSRIRLLERARLVERQGSGRQALLALTPQGRLAAAGGVDAKQRWSRTWDGQWRMLVFDLPSFDRQARVRLWRWLRGQRFGCLQHSVWISPDPVEVARLPSRRGRVGPESLAILEGRPLGLGSDLDLVNSAWEWARINQAYQRCLDTLAAGPGLAADHDTRPTRWRQWLATEREAWLAALAMDPLLPEALLPAGYLGRRAWERRTAAFSALARRGPGTEATGGKGAAE